MAKDLLYNLWDKDHATPEEEDLVVFFEEKDKEFAKLFKSIKDRADIWSKEPPIKPAGQ